MYLTENVRVFLVLYILYDGVGVFVFSLARWSSVLSGPVHSPPDSVPVASHSVNIPATAHRTSTFSQLELYSHQKVCPVLYYYLLTISTLQSPRLSCVYRKLVIAEWLFISCLSFSSQSAIHSACRVLSVQTIAGHVWISERSARYSKGWLHGSGVVKKG